MFFFKKNTNYKENDFILEMEKKINEKDNELKKVTELLDNTRKDNRNKVYELENNLKLMNENLIKLSTKNNTQINEKESEIKRLKSEIQYLETKSIEKIESVEKLLSVSSENINISNSKNVKIRRLKVQLENLLMLKSKNIDILYQLEITKNENDNLLKKKQIEIEKLKSENKDILNQLKITKNEIIKIKNENDNLLKKKQIEIEKLKSENKDILNQLNLKNIEDKKNKKVLDMTKFYSEGKSKEIKLLKKRNTDITSQLESKKNEIIKIRNEKLSSNNLMKENNKRLGDSKIILEKKISEIVKLKSENIDLLNKLKLESLDKKKTEKKLKEELSILEGVKNKNLELVENLSKKDNELKKMKGKLLKNIEEYTLKLNLLKEENNELKNLSNKISTKINEEFNKNEATDIGKKSDSIFYNEVKQYNLDDWKYITKVAENNDASPLAVIVFKELIRDLENNKLNKERLEFGMDFLKELNGKLIHDIEKKGDFININGNEKVLSLRKMKDLSMIETLKKIDSFKNKNKIYENKSEERSIVKEIDLKFILSKTKNIREYSHKDWFEVLKFDREYKILAPKEVQILTNILTRLKNNIFVNNSELANGEQCVLKAINNGFELYLLNIEDWNKFVKYSKNKILIAQKDIIFLESVLRHIIDHKKLTKDQLIRTNKLYKEFKCKVVENDKIMMIKSKSSTEKIQDNSSENQEKSNQEDLIEEMKKFTFKDWNAIFEWAKKNKSLEASDLKILSGMVKKRIFGVLSLDTLYSVLGIYFILKKTGFTIDQIVSKKESIKKSKSDLQKREKFDFNRLAGIKLEIKEAISKEYLMALEGRVIKRHINNSDIGKILEKRMYQVKRDLVDFTFCWDVGKGYRSEDLINGFKEVLERAIKKTVSEKIKTSEKAKSKDIPDKEKDLDIPDDMYEGIKKILF